MGEAGPQGRGAESRFGALRASLIAGGVYDAGFAVPILFFPAVLAGLLGLPLPGEQVYLRLIGVFLLILAGFYLATAADPERNLALVLVAIAGRVMGAAYFAVYCFGFGGEPVFLLLGAGDLGFAGLHIWAMGSRGWGRVRAFLRPRS